MHKLNRPEAPTCLATYQYGVHSWTVDSPDFAGRQEIWVCLDAMQGERCAYCERKIGPGSRHIEHFRRRCSFQHLTFDWSNLFGSCEDDDTCGKHKDSCGSYDVSLLLKPDDDDPDDFFDFLSNGTIAPRTGLNGSMRLRATETLRVFNLDTQQGGLRWRRYRAVAGYKQTLDELLDLAAAFPGEWIQFRDDEIAQTAELEFATVIRHLLRSAG